MLTGAERQWFGKHPAWCDPTRCTAYGGDPAAITDAWHRSKIWQVAGPANIAGYTRFEVHIQLNTCDDPATDPGTIWLTLVADGGVPLVAVDVTPEQLQDLAAAFGAVAAAQGVTP